LNRTTFHIAHIDCAAEEQMVRMGLPDVPGIERMEFDLGARELQVFQWGEAGAITSASSVFCTTSNTCC
jgi:hypothetical protein